MFEQATSEATLAAQLINETLAPGATAAALPGALADLPPWAGNLLFLVLVIWAIGTKMFALWRAARRGHKFWFVVLFIIETYGLLEIAYLLYLSKFDWAKFWSALGVDKIRLTRQQADKSPYQSSTKKQPDNQNTDIDKEQN